MPKPQSSNTEVVAAPENDRRHRRRWSAEEKKRILDEAAKCTERGQVSALLRKEGIYASSRTSPGRRGQIGRAHV